MAEDTPIQKNSSTENEDYKKVSFFEALKISKWGLSLFFKNNPTEMSTYIITSVLGATKDIIYTIIFAKTLDQLIKVIQKPNVEVSTMYQYLAVLLGYSVFESILSYFRGRSYRVLRTKSRLFLRRELYLKLKNLGIQTLEEPEINNKIFRSNDYIFNILPYVDQSVSLIASVIKTVTASILVAAFMPYFILIFIAISLPYLFIDKKFRRDIYKLSYENTEKRRIAGNASWELTDARSLQEISIIGAFKYMDAKFKNFTDWIINSELKMDIKSRLSWHSFNLISDVTIFFGYIQIFKRFFLSKLTIGDVTFWMRSLNILEETITNTITNFNDLSESAMQIKDVYLLFQTDPIFPDGNEVLENLKTGPNIEFKNVSFKYPNTDKFVIKNLNLKIETGEKIAIVGHNGAGKTTTVKLICKFYQATEGEILINGLNINSIKSESLYENMGTLFQDFNSYGHLTVKENIQIGKTDMDFDETKMRVAAQTADALDFIESYPNKFDTILSERYKGGIRPSSGQWQKIALARFFYRNSPLVIFDEPTAAIDAASEAKIFTKIYEFFEGKTVIIISHRFSTVRNADRIIVLDDGQIVEQGTHEELIKLGGKYANSFKLQAEGYKE